ncbi:MAG TPA: FtsX-like permease family protein [Candidatus Aminicenantes bacterium]|nr:FtsX-like permease family protein [Candidatus Aminicenantes bacterium]
MKWTLFKEITQMAFDSIKTHKLRSFLTLLGILIGVMTVIGMVSIIQGLNRSFMAELESVGSDVIIVSKQEPGVQIGGESEEIRQRKDLTLDDATAIEEECPLVKAVAVDLVANVFENIPVKYQDKKSQNSVIIGLNEKFPQVLSVYLPREGRFITSVDVLHRTKVCVLGAELKEILFPHTSALGKEIRIGAEKFRVIGVLEKRGEMFGQSRDNIVGIPITTLMKYFPYDLSGLEIIITPHKHGYIPETMDQIITVLRKRRKVAFDKPNDFSIYTQDTLLDLYNQLTGAAYLVMIAISSIGLLVGGIGVMNIMLVAVKERTREIGIRKAIGARAGDILRQFLIEAVFLTGTGGTIGVILGFLIAFLVRAATPLPASVTAWSVALGLGVSISVGLFFGIFPAQKAARTDPIVSLRYE